MSGIESFRRALEKDDPDRLDEAISSLGVERDLGHGDRPLHLAARHGPVRSIALLLDRGADIEARDGADRTPLMVAAEEARLEVAKTLLERGADPNARAAGYTVLERALQSRSSPTKIAPLLRRHGARETIMTLVAARKLAKLRALLASEPSAVREHPSATDTLSVAVSYASLATLAFKMTPEKKKAAAEGLEMVRVLLRAGADPNGNIGPGVFPPLHEAAQAIGTDLVELLLEAGADPGRRVDGRPASEYAKNDPNVRELLEARNR